MFLGSSPNLYVIFTTLVTFAFVYLGLGDFVLTPYYLAVTLNSKKDESTDKVKRRRYERPLYFSLILVGAVLACVSVWIARLKTLDAFVGVDSTAAWNQKVTWLITRMFLFSFAIFIDWYNHFDGGSSSHNTPIDQPIEETKSQATRSFTVYIFSAVVLLVYLSMLIACQIVFNSKMSAPGATQLSQNWNNAATDCIIAAVAMLLPVFILEVGVKSHRFEDKKLLKVVVNPTTKLPYRGDMGKTRTSDLVQKLIDEDVMRFDLTKTTLATDLKKFQESSIPLTLIPTGGKVYDKDITENVLLHHIENKIKAQQNPSVSLKNYTAVHVPSSNQVFVLNDDDAHRLYQITPGGELNYAKYGFLGSVRNKKAQMFSENDDFEGKEGKTIKHVLMARNERMQSMGLQMFGQINEFEPPAQRYNMHIMGFAVGNGTWYNYPVWLAACITIITLAADINIWGDGGAGLADWFICAFLPFFLGVLAYEGSWYQLFIYFQAVGTALIVLQGWFTYPGTKQYLMDKDIVYSNTSVWLQNTTYITPDVFDVQVPAYLSISLVLIFVIGYWTSVLFQVDFGRKK